MIEDPQVPPPEGADAGLLDEDGEHFGDAPAGVTAEIAREQEAGQEFAVPMENDPPSATPPR